MKSLPQCIELFTGCRLEQLSQLHAESLFQQIDCHRDFLAHFVDWTTFTNKQADTEAFIQRCAKEAEQGVSYTWAICYHGKAVGTISFNSPINWEMRTVFFGYWLSPEVQRKGIVTQAVKRVMEETYAQFDCYILKCAIHNERSNAVAKRCGFEFVERLPNAEKIGEQWYDQNCYHKVY